MADDRTEAQRLADQFDMLGACDEFTVHGKWSLRIMDECHPVKEAARLLRSQAAEMERLRMAAPGRPLADYPVQRTPEDIAQTLTFAAERDADPALAYAAGYVRSMAAELERLRNLTWCGCGDGFTEGDPGTCGTCMSTKLAAKDAELERLRDCLHDLAGAMWRLDERGYISAAYTDDEQAELDHLRGIARAAVQQARELALRRLADDECALGLDGWERPGTVTVQRYEGSPYAPEDAR